VKSNILLLKNIAKKNIGGNKNARLCLAEKFTYAKVMKTLIKKEKKAKKKNKEK